MASIDNRYTTPKSLNDIKKLEKERTELKVRCECGHTISIIDVDRTICGVCGHWVYRTPELKFKYKLKEQLNK